MGSGRMVGKQEVIRFLLLARHSGSGSASSHRLHSRAECVLDRCSSETSRAHRIKLNQMGKRVPRVKRVRRGSRLCMCVPILRVTVRLAKSLSNTAERGREFRTSNLLVLRETRERGSLALAGRWLKNSFGQIHIRTHRNEIDFQPFMPPGRPITCPLP